MNVKYPDLLPQKSFNDLLKPYFQSYVFAILMLQLALSLEEAQEAGATHVLSDQVQVLRTVNCFK